MPGVSFKAFFAIAVGCIVFLSLSWILVGEWYYFALVGALSLFVDANVTMGVSSSGLSVTVTPAQNVAAEPVALLFNIGMAHGLILAISILMAIPGIKYQNRIVFALWALLIAFIAHVVGLYIVIESLESTPSESASGLRVARALELAWLVIPSMLWLPVLLRQWQSFSANTVTNS